MAELNNGEIAIIDFKSAKDAYASHFFQAGGYDLQITENGGFDFEGKQLFKLDKPITQHIIVPFGAKEPYPVVSRLIEENKELIILITSNKGLCGGYHTNIFKALNNYLKKNFPTSTPFFFSLSTSVL